MTHWDNLWRFNTRRFAVTLDCTPERHPDLSLDDADTIAAIERGDMGVWLFRVRVTCAGREIGCDYLGNSIYADPSDFRDHMQPGACGSYFTDMVREAIREARAFINSIPNLHT